MKTDKRTDYATRDSILKLLSDDEVVSVSTAETAAKLEDGDEYVDLEELAQGVQRARGARLSPDGLREERGGETVLAAWGKTP